MCSYKVGEDRCPGNEVDYHMPHVKCCGTTEESQTDLIWSEKRSLVRVRAGNFVG